MRITHRRAFFDYEILEKKEAGINLSGAEVKAVRGGHADLTGSHVKIIGSEAYLINAKIYPYSFARDQDYDERRTRKLLLHKKEILAFKSKAESGGLAIVALALYTTPHLVKVEIALAKGKKKYEKKETLKKKDIQRAVEQELEELK